MKHAIRIAGALALATGLGSAWAGDVTVKDTKNLIDDGIVCGSLGDIRSQPHAYYKSRVKFVARFDKVGEIHQPFFTIFDAQTHTNFAAWDESTDLRTSDGYLDVFPLLYLDRRRGDQMEALFDLHKFQRFECVGIVQSVFSSQPFIEVLTLKPLDRTWAPDMHKRHAFGLAQPAKHSHDPATSDPCECGYTPTYHKGAAATTATPPATIETIETAESNEDVTDAETPAPPIGTIATSHPDVYEVVTPAVTPEATANEPATPPAGGGEGER